MIKEIKKIIIWTACIFFISWACYTIWQYLLAYLFSPIKDITDGLGHIFGLIFYIIVVIPGLIYSWLPLPKEFIGVFIILITFTGTYVTLYLIERNQDHQKQKKDILKTMKNDENAHDLKPTGRPIITEQEIERRKMEIQNILYNLYKNTEKEVNKTLIPTLINEIYDIYKYLNSKKIEKSIHTDNTEEFNYIINSIKTDLIRIRNLALDAQKKGNKNYNHENITMTKERAFKILELNENATSDDIKKAYRNLVLKFNTDQRNHYEDHIKQMLEDKMKEINSANDYLKKKGFI